MRRPLEQRDARQQRIVDTADSAPLHYPRPRSTLPTAERFSAISVLRNEIGELSISTFAQKWSVWYTPRMKDVSEQVADLSHIIGVAHENKWVAISPDYSCVLGTADTLRELMRSINDDDAIFHRVLPHDVSFAPAA